MGRRGSGAGSQGRNRCTGESLSPTGDISRSDAALYLYRLFMLLYEVSPVAITVDSASAGSELPVPATIAAGAVLLLIGAAMVFIRRKKAVPVSDNVQACDAPEAVSPEAEGECSKPADEANGEGAETEKAGVE